MQFVVFRNGAVFPLAGGGWFDLQAHWSFGVIVASSGRVRAWRTFARLVTVALVIALLWWTFGHAPLEEVWSMLKGLGWEQIAILLLVNAGIVLALPSRWWLILKFQNQVVPYLHLVAYRLASFAVSYFTPGPQIGGVPLQMVFLGKREDVPSSVAIASVSLERLLELISNFSFLLLGLSIVLASPWTPARFREVGLPLSVGMLGFPLVYLLLIMLGVRPLTRLVEYFFADRIDGRIFETIVESEAQISTFCTTDPLGVIQLRRFRC